MLSNGDEAAALPELALRLGHAFADLSLLERALTHSSKAYEAASAGANEAGSAGKDRGNEQMEFLGDAVLGMVAAEWLYRRGAEAGEDEGRLTRMRAALVSRRNLSQVARRLELGAHLRLGRGEERSGGRQKSALLADALEAVIAAIYLDGGLPAAAAFVDREIMAAAGEPAAPAEIEDCKSAVQEWLQARGKDRAVYALVASGGPDHAKSFTVELRVDDEVLAQSTAGSKKLAEQTCAQAALETLRQRQAR